MVGVKILSDREPAIESALVVLALSSQLWGDGWESQVIYDGTLGRRQTVVSAFSHSGVPNRVLIPVEDDLSPAINVLGVSLRKKNEITLVVQRRVCQVLDSEKWEEAEAYIREDETATVVLFWRNKKAWKSALERFPVDRLPPNPAMPFTNRLEILRRLSDWHEKNSYFIEEKVEAHYRILPPKLRSLDFQDAFRQHVNGNIARCVPKPPEVSRRTIDVDEGFLLTEIVGGEDELEYRPLAEKFGLAFEGSISAFWVTIDKDGAMELHTKHPVQVEYPYRDLLAVEPTDQNESTYAKTVLSKCKTVVEFTPDLARFARHPLLAKTLYSPPFAMERKDQCIFSNLRTYRYRGRELSELIRLEETEEHLREILVNTRGGGGGEIKK